MFEVQGMTPYCPLHSKPEKSFIQHHYPTDPAFYQQPEYDVIFSSVYSWGLIKAHTCVYD